MANSRSFLFALAAFAIASPVFAAPAKPLIIVFTPGISADAKDYPPSAPADALRLRTVALALRDQFEETGIVDAVVYSPDSAVFERAMLEAHLHPGNPAIPSAEESYSVARAAGASYVAMVSTVADANTTANSVSVELRTEEVDTHKTWKSRRSANAVGAGTQQSSAYANSVSSVANTLVDDFLAGPLHSLSTATPTLPDAQPIPTVHETPAATQESGMPNLIVPAPTTVPLAVPTVSTTAPSPADRIGHAASGGEADHAAEAEFHQGQDLIRSGDVSNAILSYRRAVSLAPRNALYRTALAEAYLAANRTGDALSEAKRTLTILPTDDRKGRLAVMREYFGDILTKNGDTTAARTMYEEIIKAQPNAGWAKIALADLLQTDGQTDEAELLYKQVISLTPIDRDARLGYARLLATKGNYTDALRELTAATDASDPAAKYRTSIDLFDDGVNKIADLVEQNRTAWEAKRIAQDVFYKATSAQSAKVSGLVSLLKAVPPPPGSTERVKQGHSKRILAASLLLQGVASLLSEVETGNADDGSQASLYLGEFHREIKDVGESGATVPVNTP